MDDHFKNKLMTIPRQIKEALFPFFLVVQLIIIMGFRIVIAGEKQCQIFAEICLIADYLSQNLPNFCYDRIEKSVLEWEVWLSRINVKNKWHHMGSPIVWKEMLMKGSSPVLIGGAPDFLEYCHSYYHFDVFLNTDKFEGIVRIFDQKKRKLVEVQRIIENNPKPDTCVEDPPKTAYTVTITGVRNLIAMPLISALLDLARGEKNISKIFIHDHECSEAFIESIETECSFVNTHYPTKVVKAVDKLGSALTVTDIFIILDYVAFHNDMSIGEWIFKNKSIMNHLSLIINASASRKMMIVLPNVGPACYNATILRKSVTICKNNVFVATSDLGLEILPLVSEIAEIPMRNIFCPPVWGFVGINHLVDVRTTVHKYNTFEPYNRYIKVRNSSLNIGSVSSEMRCLEYLLHFDDTLWIKVADMKQKFSSPGLNKIIALSNLIKVLLLDPDPSYVLCMGISCNGSFGLTFDGVFSQPVRNVNGVWVPAHDFLLPKDSQMKLKYLEEMAMMMMSLNKTALPKLLPYYPCSCKRKYFKRKEVW